MFFHVPHATSPGTGTAWDAALLRQALRQVAAGGELEAETPMKRAWTGGTPMTNGKPHDVNLELTRIFDDFWGIYSVIMEHLVI
jgi:hypothetical protein